MVSSTYTKSDRNASERFFVGLFVLLKYVIISHNYLDTCTVVI